MYMYACVCEREHVQYMYRYMYMYINLPEHGIIGSSECTTVILVYYKILHTMETGVPDDLFDNIQVENNHLAKQGQVLRGYFY